MASSSPRSLNADVEARAWFFVIVFARGRMFALAGRIGLSLLFRKRDGIDAELFLHLVAMRDCAAEIGRRPLVPRFAGRGRGQMFYA